MTRYRFVDCLKAAGFPVAAACRAAGVSASACYEWKHRQQAGPGPADQAEELVGEIRQIHADSGATYSSPRIPTELRRRGWQVNHKRVERLMRRHNIAAVLPRQRVRTTIPGEQPAPAPDLVERDFTPGVPNRR